MGCYVAGPSALPISIQRCVHTVAEGARPGMIFALRQAATCIGPRSQSNDILHIEEIEGSGSDMCNSLSDNGTFRTSAHIIPDAIACGIKKGPTSYAISQYNYTLSTRFLGCIRITEWYSIRRSGILRIVAIGILTVAGLRRPFLTRSLLPQQGHCSVCHLGCGCSLSGQEVTGAPLLTWTTNHEPVELWVVHSGTISGCSRRMTHRLG